MSIETTTTLKVSIWEHPTWKSMVYRWVLVQLPDKTSFYLESREIMAYHAERIAKILDVRPVAVLDQQLFPAVQANPEILLDFARQLPTDVAFSLASKPYWRTAKIFSQEWWPSRASLALQAIAL